MGTPSKRSIILLDAVHDCPYGKTAAIARHVKFAQITCKSSSAVGLLLTVSSKICNRFHAKLVNINRNRLFWRGTHALTLPYGGLHV